MDTGCQFGKRRLIMKDHFYVVLPSNSSMQYFPENTLLETGPLLTPQAGKHLKRKAKE